MVTKQEIEKLMREGKLPITVQVTKGQAGSTDEEWDAKLKSMAPGKRISKSGKIYWETRKNRSDKLPSKI
jgi:hypothetical protein